MEELSRSTEYSETTLLVSKPQQNRLIRRLKIWTLGVGSIAVSVATAFPVAIINNWKKSGTLSFKNGIDDFVDKKFSKDIKIKSVIKNLILNLTLIATNEIVKKINEKLTTSVLVNTDIFDDLFVTVVLSFSAEVAVVIMWKIFEIWKKYIEDFDFYSIGIPILSTVGYFLFNSLQTVYNLGKNNLLLEDFIKTFLPIFVENTVVGIFRATSSSLFYYQIGLLFNNDKRNDSMIIPSFSYGVINGINEAKRKVNLLMDKNPAIIEDTNMPASKIVSECKNTLLPLGESKQKVNYNLTI